jgi:mannosyltransferase OCH1-like enzyme
MSSWAKKNNSQMPIKGIYTSYDSEDNNFIYLNFQKNTTNYPDSDIAYIIRKTNDYYAVEVETITRDNSFSPYTLYIDGAKYHIKSSIDSIRLITVTKCKVISSNTKIPKTLIHTWNTKDIEHTDLMYPIKINKKLNPDYSHCIYNNTECLEFIRDNYDSRVLNAYNKLKPGAFKADLWRYCYLYKYGGIYCDIKNVFRKSFNALLNNTTKLIIGKSMFNDGAHNGFMACLPNEPLMKLAIDTSVERIENNYYGKSSLDITGPVMLEYCFTKLYGVTAEKYVNNQNSETLMVLYNDINNYNCFLYNNNIIAHTYFSTYYTQYRTAPYVVLWNNKDVYNTE